ncbi:MAG: hypothetical protein KIS85_04775 [Anaerolineales bacterium]|nr:hypothetical protein [Anaerolineales bacterium]
MDAWLLNVVLALLALTGLGLLLSRDWRWRLGCLGAAYLLTFLLVSQSWPLELAAVKLVGGWMATAVLGLTRLNLPERPADPPDFPRSPFFLGLAAGLVIVIVSGSAPALAAWSRQFDAGIVWGGLFLIGMGLLQVGLSGSIFGNGLGLLTLLAGFEILYAEVETSILVAGLLALLTLGVALASAYLMQAPTLEPRE